MGPSSSGVFSGWLIVIKLYTATEACFRSTRIGSPASAEKNTRLGTLGKLLSSNACLVRHMQAQPASKYLCLIRHGQGEHNPRKNPLALGFIPAMFKRDAKVMTSLSKPRNDAAAAKWRFSHDDRQSFAVLVFVGTAQLSWTR